jgi:plastocyanin
MDTTERDAADLEAGDVVLVDGQPCLVTDVAETQGGKHGTAKVNAETEGLYDGEEHALSQPADAVVEVVAVESGTNPLVMVSADPGGHFDPPVVRVSAGSRVVWLWDDDAAHEVRAADGAFASDRTDGEGFTFEHTFADAGRYRYDCGVHGASGVVLVE